MLLGSGYSQPTRDWCFCNRGSGVFVQLPERILSLVLMDTHPSSLCKDSQSDFVVDPWILRSHSVVESAPRGGRDDSVNIRPAHLQHSSDVQQMLAGNLIISGDGWLNMPKICSLQDLNELLTHAHLLSCVSILFACARDSRVYIPICVSVIPLTFAKLGLIRYPDIVHLNKAWHPTKTKNQVFLFKSKVQLWAANNSLSGIYKV